MNCQFCARKWLVRLANMGWCHHLCSLDQLERLTLVCSKVSQDRFRIRFVKFCEETRRQMPWEGGHPTSLAGEEMNSTVRFSPSICDLFLYTPLIGFNLLILFNFTHEELQFKPQISAHFSLWSLVSDLCNLTLN